MKECTCRVIDSDHTASQRVCNQGSHHLCLVANHKFADGTHEYSHITHYYFEQPLLLVFILFYFKFPSLHICLNTVTSDQVVTSNHLKTRISKPSD